MREDGLPSEGGDKARRGKREKAKDDGDKKRMRRSKHSLENTGIRKKVRSEVQVVRKLRTRRGEKELRMKEPLSSDRRVTMEAVSQSPGGVDKFHQKAEAATSASVFQCRDSSVHRTFQQIAQAWAELLPLKMTVSVLRI